MSFSRRRPRVLVPGGGLAAQNRGSADVSRPSATGGRPPGSGRRGWLPLWQRNRKRRSRLGAAVRVGAAQGPQEELLHRRVYPNRESTTSRYSERGMHTNTGRAQAWPRILATVTLSLGLAPMSPRGTCHRHKPVRKGSEAGVIARCGSSRLFRSQVTGHSHPTNSRFSPTTTARSSMRCNSAHILPTEKHSAWPFLAAGFTAGDNRRVRGRQIAVSDARAIGQQHTHQGQRGKKKKSAPRSHSSRRQKERNGPQEETAVTRGTTTQARARRPAPRQSDDDDAASRKARTARRHVSPGRRCSGEGVFFSPRCCRGRCHQLLPPLFVGARANVVRGESTTVQPQVARWRR